MRVSYADKEVIIEFTGGEDSRDLLLAIATVARWMDRHIDVALGKTKLEIKWRDEISRDRRRSERASDKAPRG